MNTTGLVHYGLTWSDYTDQFETFKNDGYRPVLVSGYTVSFQPRFVTIWETNNVERWESKIGLSESEFDSRFDTLSAQDGANMMMTHATVYLDRSDTRFGDIWQPWPPATGWWMLYHMSQEDFQTAQQKRAEDGLYISHISGYNIAGADLYAALWHEFTSSDRVVELGLSDTGFRTINERRKGKGYRPVVISGYPVQGDPRYACIWEKSQVDDWAIHIGLTGSELTSKLEEYDSEGLQLRHLDGYGIQGEARYAAIWETPI